MIAPAALTFSTDGGGAAIVGRAVLDSGDLSRSPSRFFSLSKGNVVVQGTNLSASIGKDGKFSIKGVTPGIYSLYGKSEVDGKVKAFWKEAVTVLANKITNLGDVAFKTTGTIKGRITCDGQPVIGAGIRIMGQKDTTDSGGYYQVSNVPYGSYRIVVKKSGYSKYSAIVSIGDVLKVHDVVLKSTLDSRPVISGHVYYLHTKIPISGATVSNGVLASTTEADGRYVLNNLLTGFQTLTVSKPGYNHYSVDVEVGSEGLEMDLELTSAVQGTLSGVVSDEAGAPLYGVRVAVLNPDGTISGLSDTTDNGGHYQIASVPQGTRDIVFSKETYVTRTESVFIADFEKNFNVTLQDGRIAPPNEFKVVDAGFYQVALSWKPVDNPNLIGYNVYRSEFSDSGFSKVNDELIPADEVTFVDGNFSKCGEYFYKIASISSYADGRPSDIVDAEPLDYVPTFVVGNRLRDITWVGDKIYVTNTRDKNLKKIAPPVAGSIPLFSTSFIHVLTALAYDGTNLLCTGYSEDVIYKLNPDDGCIVGTIQLPSSGFVALDWDGQNIWGACYDNSTIYKLDPNDGTVLAYFESPGPYPRGLAWNDGTVICTDYLSNIYVVNPENGATISTITPPSSKLYGIAAKDGFLWCADWSTGYIHKVPIE
jgi:hypothetical protein